MQGFLILNCIIGGQALASVSTRLDDSLGIVIIAIVSLVVRYHALRAPGGIVVPVRKLTAPVIVGDVLWL